MCLCVCVSRKIITSHFQAEPSDDDDDDDGDEDDDDDDDHHC